MSFQIRLDQPDQTIVISIEGDCVAVRTYCGDPRKENPEIPDTSTLFGAKSFDEYLMAMLQTRIALERESVAEFFRVMTEGFGYEAP